MIASFGIEIGQKKRRKVEKKVVWKITKEGLDKFEELTNSDLGIIISDNLRDPFTTWLNAVENAMHQCFKRITIKEGAAVRSYSKSSKIRKILSDMSKKGKIQRTLVKEYITRFIEKEQERLCQIRARNVEKAVEGLTVDGRFSPNQFWKIKKKSGTKSQSQPQAVKTNGGQIIRDPVGLKREVAKEFQHRLRNRLPDPNWEEYVTTTNEVVKTLMEKEVEKGQPFTMKEIQDVIRSMKTGTSPGSDGICTDILQRSGKGILEPLMRVFNYIKDSGEVPSKWNEVLVTLIYKNKGSHLDLVNFRGIFLTQVVSKLFEKLLQTRMNSCLKKVSLWQAGSRKGKSVRDNLFLLRGAIDHSKYLSKPLFITTYDFEQAFDSIWLEDSIMALMRLGVDEYILKLVYKLNQHAIVRIKTPHGLTDAFIATDILKQGGVFGPIVCSASTAEYCETNKGISVGTAIISSMAFVDDMLDVSNSPSEAENAHEQAMIFSNRKKWKYKPVKCNIMGMGKKACPPVLMIDGEEITRDCITEYLGDVFNSEGNNKDLFKDRLKRGIKAMVGIQAFMSENSFGKYTIGIHVLLYRMVFSASILFNAEVWTGVSDSSLRELTALQVKFLKKVLGVRKSTANSFVFLELGLLPLSYEIDIRSLSFLHHILTLSDDDPVKSLFNSFLQLPEYPNWVTNVKRLMKKYSINLNFDEVSVMPKEKYKSIVKKSVEKVAFNNLTKECKLLKRTQYLTYNELKIQSYLLHLSPKFSKLISQARSQTLDIKSQSAFKYSDNDCRWCFLEEETLDHIINCGEDLPYIDAALGTINRCEDFSKIETIGKRIHYFLDKVTE